jgi:hypothetical protein
VLLFGAVRIALPHATLCLLDGAGALTIGGELYQGRDPVYGVLDTIEGIDQLGDDAPAIRWPDPRQRCRDGRADRSGCRAARCRSWSASIATGQPVATPHSVFVGELDVPTINCRERPALEYTVVSVAERLFRWRRAPPSSAFHQEGVARRDRPRLCTDVEITLAWGQKVDNRCLHPQQPAGLCRDVQPHMSDHA